MRAAVLVAVLAVSPAFATDYAPDWVSLYSPMAGSATYSVGGYTLYGAVQQATLTRVSLNVLNTGIDSDGSHVGLRLNTTSDTTATKNSATSLRQSDTLTVMDPGGAVCTVTAMNITSYSGVTMNTGPHGCGNNYYADQFVMTGTGTITTVYGVGNCPVGGTNNVTVTWAYQDACHGGSYNNEWLCARACYDGTCGSWIEYGVWDFGTQSCNTGNNCAPTCY